MDFPLFKFYRLNLFDGTRYSFSSRFSKENLVFKLVKVFGKVLHYDDSKNAN